MMRKESAAAREPQEVRPFLPQSGRAMKGEVGDPSRRAFRG